MPRVGRANARDPHRHTARACPSWVTLDDSGAAAKSSYHANRSFDEDRALDCVVFVASSVSGGGVRGATARHRDSIRLGMKKEAFVAKFGIEPSRCASCYRGELLAQPTVESTAVSQDLATAALAMSAGSQQVDLFFEHGVLATIHMENLQSRDSIAALEKKFGKGRAIQKSRDITELEWSDDKTRMRLTRWQSEYQLTLSNRKGPKVPNRK
jgi:hypothetical protein